MSLANILSLIRCHSISWVAECVLHILHVVQLQLKLQADLDSDNDRLDLLSPPCIVFWSLTSNNAIDPYLPKNVTKIIQGTKPLVLYLTRVSTCEMLKSIGIDDDSFLWKCVRIYKSKIYTHHSNSPGSFVVGVHRHMATFTFSSHQWLASFFCLTSRFNVMLIIRICPILCIN